MNEIATRYREGQGVLKDPTAAVAWFDKAVTLHAFPAAQFNLGNMFELGVAVPQSYERAGELYTLAAIAGRAEAKFLLARLFLNGLGIERDPIKAYMLYTEAANAGSEPSAQAREKLEQQLKPEELAKAKEMLAKASSENSSAETAPTARASEKAGANEKPANSTTTAKPDTQPKPPRKETEKPAIIRKSGKR
jgi:TPR repeat protein